MKLQFDGFDTKGRIKVKCILDDPLENYVGILTDFRMAFPEHASNIDQIGNTIYLPSMLFLQKQVFSIFAKRDVSQQAYGDFISEIMKKGIPVNKVAQVEQKEPESKEQPQQELTIKFNDERHLAYMELLRMSRQMELSSQEIENMREAYNANKPMFDLSNGETRYSLQRVVKTSDGRIIASISKKAEDYEYFLFLYDCNGNILKARYSNAPSMIIKFNDQFLMFNFRYTTQVMDANLNVVSQDYTHLDRLRDIENINDTFVVLKNYDEPGLFIIARQNFPLLLQGNEEDVERFEVPVPTEGPIPYADTYFKVSIEKFFVPESNKIVGLVRGDGSNHLAFFQFKPKTINCVRMLPEGGSAPDHVDNHMVLLQKTEDSITAFWQDEKQVCQKKLDLADLNYADLNDFEERFANVEPDENNEIRDQDFVKFVKSKFIPMVQLQKMVGLRMSSYVDRIRDLKNGTCAVAYRGDDNGDIEVEIRNNNTGVLIKSLKVKDFGAYINDMQPLSDGNTLVCMASAKDKNPAPEEEEEKEAGVLTIGGRFSNGVDHYRKNIAFVDLTTGQAWTRVAYTTENYFCIVNDKVVLPNHLELSENQFGDEHIHGMDFEYTRRYHAAIRRDISTPLKEVTHLAESNIGIVVDYVGTELSYADNCRILQSVKSWPAVSFISKRSQAHQDHDAKAEPVVQSKTLAKCAP